jgi:DNA-binding transcriptional ArsR family regulator
MANAEHTKPVARFFRALSADNRVRILRILAKRTLCVRALSNLLGISAGAVSQHLAVLKAAGLVQATRRGYFLHYALVPTAAAQCSSAVDSLFVSSKADRKQAIRQKGEEPCAPVKRSARGRKT